MKRNETSKLAMSEKRIGFETPMVVSQIAESCLYSGFFGRMDSSRMKTVTDNMLSSIEQSDNDMIIIDLSNVELIDSAIAAHLINIGNVLRLVGVQIIFCGINSIVAQTMVVGGVEFEKFLTARDLQAALTLVYKIKGFELVPIRK